MKRSKEDPVVYTYTAGRLVRFTTNPNLTYENRRQKDNGFYSWMQPGMINCDKGPDKIRGWVTIDEFLNNLVNDNG
jgi:hypothetical protein